MIGDPVPSKSSLDLPKNSKRQGQLPVYSITNARYLDKGLQRSLFFDIVMALEGRSFEEMYL